MNPQIAQINKETSQWFPFLVLGSWSLIAAGNSACQALATEKGRMTGR
jgi:hypothetical protein